MSNNDVVECKLCGEAMPQGEEMFNYHGFSGPCPKPPIKAVPTVAEIAYGFLWHDISTDKRVHAARKLLLETLDKGAQCRGIEAAKDALRRGGHDVD